jgi:hypothetical protein
VQDGAGPGRGPEQIYAPCHGAHPSRAASGDSGEGCCRAHPSPLARPDPAARLARRRRRVRRRRRRPAAAPAVAPAEGRRPRPAAARQHVGAHGGRRAAARGGRRGGLGADRAVRARVHGAAR